MAYPILKISILEGSMGALSSKQIQLDLFFKEKKDLEEQEKKEEYDRLRATVALLERERDIDRERVDTLDKMINEYSLLIDQLVEFFIDEKLPENTEDWENKKIIQLQMWKNSYYESKENHKKSELESAKRQIRLLFARISRKEKTP